MIGTLRGVVRGTVAWTVGYLLMVGLVLVGVAESGSGTVGAAASAFVAAHVLPPAEASIEPLALGAVPLVAVGAVGYRAGVRRQSGVLSRLRSALPVVGESDRSRPRYALRSGGTLAVGYALVTAVVAIAIDASIGPVAASAFLTALLVAVPAAFVGTMR